MTLREEALELINKLPDKVMEDIVRSLKSTFNSPFTWETKEQERARKMRAFHELEEMRKIMPPLEPIDCKAEYHAAIAEKYGI